MRVDRDQVSLLGPGMVVVPKSFASGLTGTMSKTGNIASMPGEKPPFAIQEVPQSLPSSMSTMLSNIIEKNRESIAGKSEIATAHHGFVMTSAKDSYMFSAKEGLITSAKEGFVSQVIGMPGAEQGAVMPKDMAVFAHQGEMVLPEHISSPLQTALPAMMEHMASMTQTSNSSVRGDTHIHIAPRETTMSHEDIIRAVKTGIRKGQLGQGNL